MVAKLFYSKILEFGGLSSLAYFLFEISNGY
jgi:hypothetical protein